MSELWYRDGLKFQCTGCGGCCTGAPGYVWVNRAEVEALAKLVGLEVAEFERQFVRMVGIRRSLVEYDNGDCVFFDNKSRKCRVYEARPRQCRTWPFWPSNVASRSAWLEISRRCPGCDRGRKVPLEKIQERLKERGSGSL